MRRIATDSLTTAPVLPRPLFHESGALLFEAGERLSEEEIGLLRRAGVRRVYDLGGDEGGGPGPDRIAGEDSRTAPLPAFARGQAAPEEPALPPDEVRVFRREKRAQGAYRAIERAAASLPEARRILDPRAELRNGGVDRAIARAKEGERPEGTPWRERLLALRPEFPRGAREKQAAVEARAALVARLARVFQALRAGGAPDERPLALSKELLDLAARDVDVAIALAVTTPGAAAESPDEALARHSWNVGVLAAATSIELGYSLEQVVEIAAAALLHDVGMVRLPEALAKKPALLDDEEEKELKRHPVHAIEVLRRFAEVPVALAAVAYEEHERPDGSGYPRGISEPGELARIVATADVFDALASPRPHRPARPPHLAVREIVALAAKKKLDARVLRGLLKAVTLFPIGTFVRLSDGALGRVVHAGAADPARPVVARLADLEDAQGPPTPPAFAAGRGPRWMIDLSSCPELKIAEADLAAPPALVDKDPLAGF